MTESPQDAEKPLHLVNIEGSLRKVLASSRFKESAQLQALLTYIVKVSIQGHDESLKERVIGLEVFGRKSDYDTADDPIVRSRMGLLRKRLAQYYESEEAAGSAVQIVIPNGSYRPSFIFRPEESKKATETYAEVADPTVVPVLTEPPALEGSVVSGRASVFTPRRRLIFPIAISFVLIIAIWAASQTWRKNELYLVWKPLLDEKKTILMYTGTINPVYLSPESGAAPTPLYDEHSATELVSSKALTGDNFIPIRDGVAPSGDIAADIKVAVLLNTNNRNLSLRSGSGLPFVELKGSPVVLVGAYDNHWTMELSRDLPFYFDQGGKIQERAGKHQSWSSIARADNTISEDYALIFRLLDSKTGGPVIAIAGLTTCGTQAAAEFMTDSLQMHKLSTISRSALETKNLELVLHATLVNCTPTSVNIVGQQVW